MLLESLEVAASVMDYRADQHMVHCATNAGDSDNNECQIGQ